MTLAVNDVGGQTLGGAMLDKYLYGADVSFQKSQVIFVFTSFFLNRLFYLFTILLIYRALKTWKIGIQRR